MSDDERSSGEPKDGGDNGGNGGVIPEPPPAKLGGMQIVVSHLPSGDYRVSLRNLGPATIHHARIHLGDIGFEITERLEPHGSVEVGLPSSGGLGNATSSDPFLEGTATLHIANDDGTVSQYQGAIRRLQTHTGREYVVLPEGET